MKLGLRLPTFTRPGDFSSGETLKQYVAEAEQLGVEGFFVIDHILTSRPAYSTSWHDPLIALSFVAAATKKAVVGPMIMVLPYRNPYIVAKQTASLDVYSGGRFVLGAGVGWNPDEFTLLNTPLEKRGAIMDEYLVLLKKLWTEDKITFEGNFFKVRDLVLEPKPMQKPHPPIWIGGGSQPHEILYGAAAKGIDKVLQRIARFADGWIPHSSSTPEMATQDWQKVKKYAAEIGRDPYRITKIYSNFVYLRSPGEDDSEAVKRFSLYSGMNLEYWRNFYLYGTVEEVAEKIKKRIESLEGVDWVVLNPVTFEKRQLLKIVEELYPRVQNVKI
ncbi:MAG: TIGR03619 family F420-dependent LLM class oxidoreductase [Candidatus Caldarchaeum sp.]|nr:TIGR03619 family F420-dependent LLM class oxidoreductase [Candidatus Caldarchaeum sp.]MDW8435208.1 TIGR03619 family F420-dependent LLM class oxidoreductase [Candidatus Caldarchaeum sp.]